MALAHAILALLADCPQSGYDLNKAFDGSVGFFWKATHQQIYRELAKLEDQGWVHSEVVPQMGRPDKKLFRVSDRGREVLTDWISQPCEPPPTRDELLIKVFMGALVDREVILQQIIQHRQQHQEQLRTFEQIEAEFFPNPQQSSPDALFRYLTLRRGIRHEQEWLAWCDEAIHWLTAATQP
jgi:DNA-binding PadR family transcriptional regulator